MLTLGQDGQGPQDPEQQAHGLDDRVVVQPSEAEETTAGGIVLPDSAKEKPAEGIIVAVGGDLELVDTIDLGFPIALEGEIARLRNALADTNRKLGQYKPVDLELLEKSKKAKYREVLAASAGST